MTKLNPSVYKRFKKFVATTVSFSFLFNNIVFAHSPQTSLWNERAQNIRHPGDLLAGISTREAALQMNRGPGQILAGATALPTQFGVVRETYRVAGQQPLLLIQDIHLNYEAQSNVARMLAQLQENRHLGNVGVEGAFEHFNFKPFFDAGDQKVRQIVADAFLKANRIGAPSYVGVTSAALPENFSGVDDRALYKSNVASYRAGFKRQATMLSALDERRRALTGKKNIVFNRELLALDAMVESYQAGKTGLAELLEKIPPTTPALAQFVEAARLEKKIDFARAEKEKRAVLEKLAPKLTPSEVEQLTLLGAAHQSGDVSSADFYRVLTSLLKQHGVSAEHSPALNAYLHYTTLADAINGTDLINDIQPAISAALQAAATNDAERELIAQSRRLQLEAKLLHFALTPAEWNEYKFVIPAKAGIQSLNIPLKMVGTLDSRLRGNDGLQAFENFYRFADQRSAKIVDNFLGLKQSKGTSTLIIGGFHTPGVTAELKKRGIAYVVMSPKVTKVEADGSAYLSVFSREKTPLEKVFAGERLFINPDTLGLGTSASDSNGDFIVGETGLLTGSGILRYGQNFYVVGGRLPWFYIRVGKPEVIGGQEIQPIVSWWAVLRNFLSALFHRSHIFVLATGALLLNAGNAAAGNGEFLSFSHSSIFLLAIFIVPIILGNRAASDLFRDGLPASVSVSPSEILRAQQKLDAERLKDVVIPPPEDPALRSVWPPSIPKGPTPEEISKAQQILDAQRLKDFRIPPDPSPESRKVWPPVPPGAKRDVPGAMGFWHGSDKSFAEKGFIEGALAMIVGLSVMSVVFPILPAEMEPIFKYFTVLSAGLLVAFGFNFLGHRLFGVDVGLPLGPSRDWHTILSATETANSALWGIPLLAGVFFVPQFTGVALFFLGLFVMAGNHAVRNLPFDWRDWPLTLKEKQLANELKSKRLKSILDIGFIGSENLNDYNPERRALAEYARDNASTSAASLFIRHAAAQNTRAFKVGQLAEIIKPQNHQFLVPAGGTIDQIEAEIRDLLKVKPGEQAPKLSVYLNDRNKAFSSDLSNHLPGIQFFTDAELADVKAIEQLLLLPLANGGQLQVLLHGTDNLPVEVINTLMSLAHSRYEQQVRFILINVIAANAMAVEIDRLQDMQALVKFIELVGEQA